MTLSRRKYLGLGGGLAATLILPSRSALTEDVVEIRMVGKPDGSRVWFNPLGLHLQPGQRVRWVNRDVANSHTSTAYHPSNYDRARRIPQGAKAWDSGYLLPGESFELRLTVEGVYDYYCVPHEMAGMVGRIVVGANPQNLSWEEQLLGEADVPAAALNGLPSVNEILNRGRVQLRVPAYQEDSENHGSQSSR